MSVFLGSSFRTILIKRGEGKATQNDFLLFLFLNFLLFLGEKKMIKGALRSNGIYLVLHLKGKILCRY